MRFDSSANTQSQVRRSLGLDPRMIRFSVVKIGDKLHGPRGAMENITGQVEWESTQDASDAAGLGAFEASQTQRGARTDTFGRI